MILSTGERRNLPRFFACGGSIFGLHKICFISGQLPDTRNAAVSLNFFPSHRIKKFLPLFFLSPIRHGVSSSLFNLQSDKHLLSWAAATIHFSWTGFRMGVNNRTFLSGLFCLPLILLVVSLGPWETHPPVSSSASVFHNRHSHEIQNQSHYSIISCPHLWVGRIVQLFDKLSMKSAYPYDVVFVVIVVNQSKLSSIPNQNAFVWVFDSGGAPPPYGPSAALSVWMAGRLQSTGASVHLITISNRFRQDDWRNVVRMAP